jgi:hypothetical protein
MSWKQGVLRIYTALAVVSMLLGPGALLWATPMMDGGDAADLTAANNALSTGEKYTRSVMKFVTAGLIIGGFTQLKDRPGLGVTGLGAGGGSAYVFDLTNGIYAHAGSATGGAVYTRLSHLSEFDPRFWLHDPIYWVVAALLVTGVAMSTRRRARTHAL